MSGETSTLPKDGNQASIQALRPKATSSLTITINAAITGVAVAKGCQVVRLVSTVDTCVSLGTAPTATTADMPLTANLPEYIKAYGGIDFISAIRASTATANGTLYITEMT